MKKSIIIICSVVMFSTLTAFGFINWNNSVTSETNDKVEDADFYYGIGSRFDPITKAELNNANSILDFLDETQAPQMESIESVTIIIVDDDKPTDIREVGTSVILTKNQLNLLQSSDYSTDFSVHAEGTGVNSENGEVEYSKFNPYLTIVPEKQAVYVNGEEALLSYFRSNNKKNLEYLEKDKLRPAKLYFTVTKDGKISNVGLDRSSGYEPMDETMISLIKNVSGKWDPAENADGEKVDQELVITFSMNGC